jgi:hypothetical protein
MGRRNRNAQTPGRGEGIAQDRPHMRRNPFITEAGVTGEDVQQSLEQVKGLIERIMREVRP